MRAATKVFTVIGEWAVHHLFTSSSTTSLYFSLTFSSRESTNTSSSTSCVVTLFSNINFKTSVSLATYWG